MHRRIWKSEVAPTFRKIALCGIAGLGLLGFLNMLFVLSQVACALLKRLSPVVRWLRMGVGVD